MPTNTTGPIKDVSREVKYLNKAFEGFRNDLIGFAKTYFPVPPTGSTCLNFTIFRPHTLKSHYFSASPYFPGSLYITHLHWSSVARDHCTVILREVRHLASSSLLLFGGF